MFWQQSSVQESIITDLTEGKADSIPTKITASSDFEIRAMRTASLNKSESDYSFAIADPSSHCTLSESTLKGENKRSDLDSSCFSTKTSIIKLPMVAHSFLNQHICTNSDPSLAPKDVSPQRHTSGNEPFSTDDSLASDITHCSSDSLFRDPEHDKDLPLKRLRSSPPTSDSFLLSEVSLDTTDTVPTSDFVGSLLLSLIYPI